MPETVVVLSLEDGIRVASRVFEMLSGKVFDVVSIHSKRIGDLNVLEEASLKEMSLVSTDTLVKIRLNPRRCLCFDVKESPVVTFVSDRRIDLMRELSKQDTLTKIILINQGRFVEEKPDV